MNRSLAVFLLAAHVMTVGPLSAGTPHTVTGQVRNHDSSVPADGTVTFSAYVTSRPGEVQTQATTGAGYSGGYWYVNTGNFSSNWSVGEVLRVNFHNTSTGENASLNFTLTSSDPDVAPTVNFPAPTFTVTFAVNPAGGGTTSPAAGGHTYSVGTVVPITATPSTGYQFVNWTRTGSGTFGDANSASTNFTVSGTATVTANYTLIPRTLTMAVNPGGGGTTSPAAGTYTYDHGTVVTVTASPSAGYRFASWTGGVANSSSATTTVTMDANKTVTANFTAVYTLNMGVSPSSGGTTSPSAGSHTIDAGFAIGISATAAWGYQFSGWTGDVADPGSATTYVIVNGNKTVTANFSLIPRILTMAMNPAGGGTVNPAVGTWTYNHGTAVTLTATPSPGYGFVSWTGDVSGTASSVTTVMTSNKTVTANFSLTRTLTVAVSPSGGGTTNPYVGPHYYPDGTVVTLTAVPAPGYLFVSWSGGVANPSGATTTLTMNANKTVTANFALARTLTMAASPPSGGSLSPSAGPHDYPEGTVVTVTANPATGYQFSGWTGDVANPAAATTTVTLNAHKTVTARFTLIPRTLTMAVSPAGGGTTAPATGSHTVDHGTVVTITATPASGYMFTGWTGEVADPAGATTTVTMNENRAVTANFALVRTLTLAVNPAGAGSTGPSAGPHDYAHGTVVTITATPAAGNIFAGWTGDVADPASATTTVTMSGNRTVTANFAIVRTLTLAVNPAGAGTTDPPAGTHNRADGAVVAITASAAIGYRFVNWTGGATEPAQPATTVTMDANKTVTANFVAGEILTLAVNPAGTGTTDPAAGTHTYDRGTVVTVTATAADGYRFLSWTGDVADPASPATTVTMGGPRTVTARFGPVPRTLTLGVDPAAAGTTVPPAGPHTYDHGTTVTLTAAANPGFLFTGWTGGVTDPDTACTTVLLNGDLSVTAHFDTARVLTLAVSPAGSGTTVPSAGPHQFADGQVVVITAVPAPGRRFMNWTGDVVDPNNASTTATVRGNCTVTANFATGGRTLTLAVSPDGGGTTVPSTGTHVCGEGEVVAVTAVPAPGFRFLTWTGSVADRGSASTTITLTSDRTIWAVFVPTFMLTMTASPPEGGTTFPCVGAHAYDIGTAVGLIATPGAGYRFAGWAGDVNDPESAGTRVVLDTDKSVTARFIRVRSLILAASPSEGGTTDPPPGTHVFDDGSTVFLTAAPAAGYRFVSWTGGVADPAAVSTTVPMAADRTVTAHFALVDAVEESGGSDSPESFALLQNYPNPFNPSTRVVFQLPKTAGVLLTVCNSNGQRIRTLLNETRPAGNYEAVWDGKDDSGNAVGSGIYYCRMTAGSFSKVMKMIYMR